MLFELIAQLFQNLLWFPLHLAGSSFPRPLSAKDERECFEQMHAGSKEARDKLINHNMRLVAHIIKKYYTNPNDQDDLISIGTIGLIKAVDSFRFDKNVRFATYAARCIENEVLMQFRAARKSQNVVFINDPLDTDADGNALTILDVISDDVDIGENYEHRNDLKQMRDIVDRHLTGREKLVIEKRFGLANEETMTQQQVADSLDISRSYVSRIEKKALNHLREKFFEK